MRREFVGCRDGQEDVAGVVSGGAVGADLGEADAGPLGQAGELVGEHGAISAMISQLGLGV